LLSCHKPVPSARRGKHRQVQTENPETTSANDADTGLTQSVKVQTVLADKAGNKTVEEVN